MDFNNDLAGQRFGRLIVIGLSNEHGHYGKLWLCKCDCGGEKLTTTYKLKSGKVKSCGCLEKENLDKISKHKLKHGLSESILYKKWCGMKARCFNPHYKFFERYGGRGITVCEKWLGEHGFEHFKDWAYSAGYDDSKEKYEQTLDRINTNGNYCPENCKWSNQLEQVKNRSNSRLILDIDGESLTADQFDKKHCIEADMFTYRRITKGFSAQQILDEWNIYLDAKNGKYYTKNQAASLYGVTTATIANWMRKGLLHYVTSRNHTYILKDQSRPVFNK